MEGESGEQVGGELQCDIISRVFCARLAEWDMKLIPEMRWMAHANQTAASEILSAAALQNTKPWSNDKSIIERYWSAELCNYFDTLDKALYHICTSPRK